MKIGLVGEAPNDTRAIENLLSKKYKRINFITLLNNMKGSMLDSTKTLEFLKNEYLSNKPDLIIFIRDLDSVEKGGKLKIAERGKKFNTSNRAVEGIGILLLNIYELEALILADIDTFNNHYGCSIPKVEDPMKVPEPKELLINATRLGTKEQFNVSHNPELFGLLNFDTIKQNCKYFSDFIKKFDEVIQQKQLKKQLPPF